LKLTFRFSYYANSFIYNVLFGVFGEYYRGWVGIYEVLGGFGENLRVWGAFEDLGAFKRSWEVLGGIWEEVN